MASSTTAAPQLPMRLDPSTGWTCLACKLVFSSGQLQRDHYRSEWHMYNMKRQIAGLPPVTQSDFLEKLQHFSQHQQQSTTVDDENNRFSSSITAPTSLPSSSSLVCAVCRNKRFRSRNAFDNHLQSRRHKEEEEEQQLATAALNEDAKKCQTAPVGGQSGDDGIEEMLAEAIMEKDDGIGAEHEHVGVDGAEMMKQTEGNGGDGGAKKEDGIAPNECLFCEHKSDSWEPNLKHMIMQHGFMIPDSPFCADVPALLTYLGFKIGVGLTCIRCQCARFRSLDALRKHMRDSNHCNFRIDSQQEEGGDVLLEFMDFYDYDVEQQQQQQSGDKDGEEDSSDDDDDDDDDQHDKLNTVLYDEGAFLVLPSGARIGHRSLVRYFRQRLNYPIKMWQRLMFGGGCKARCGPVLEAHQIKEVKARARDVSFMKRTVARYQLKRELAANKLFKSRGRNDQQ